MDLAFEGVYNIKGFGHDDRTKPLLFFVDCITAICFYLKYNKLHLV